MKPSTKVGLAGLAGLALLALVHRVRDAGVVLSPVAATAVGILPNLAAAIAITFVLLSIWLDQRPLTTLAAATRPLLVCAAISGIGLTGWELIQLSSSSFVFDYGDLAATWGGIGLSALLFHLLSRR